MTADARGRLPVVLISRLGLPHGEGVLRIELLEPTVDAIVGSVIGHDQRLLQPDLVLQNLDVARCGERQGVRERRERDRAWQRSESE
jgi:hypothetical protein